MLPIDPDDALARLMEFQRTVRDALIAARSKQALNEVAHESSADTIYRIDAEVDPLLEAFCEEWGRTTPLVLVAEGIVDEHGHEGPLVFPRDTREEDALVRLIVDPIDGTRMIMYDKRSAWALAGLAPNKGAGTRLSDIEVACMTELPTSKQGYADVLTAIKGRGTHARRFDLKSGASSDLPIAPSSATTIAHGFAAVANFFPGTKQLASELMERIALELVGPPDVGRAMVFDDQYITTGGQMYELVIGHDRFVADLRSLFYAKQDLGAGLCVHPYDCAAWLVAAEAGVILTDGLGNPLDGPLDCTTNLSWAGFANRTLFERIQPVIRAFFG
ncbi:MAG: hypothetical protein QM770_04670 [Tepidisphaeraceae bacterium]